MRAALASAVVRNPDRNVRQAIESNGVHRRESEHGARRSVHDTRRAARVRDDHERWNEDRHVHEKWRADGERDDDRDTAMSPPSTIERGSTYDRNGRSISIDRRWRLVA